MTENQREEMLKDIRDGYIDAWDNLAIDELFSEIEKEHTEIQAYKAVGPVDEVVNKNDVIRSLQSRLNSSKAGSLEYQRLFSVIKEVQNMNSHMENKNIQGDLLEERE